MYKVSIDIIEQSVNVAKNSAELIKALNDGRKIHPASIKKQLKANEHYIKLISLNFQPHG